MNLSVHDWLSSQISAHDSGQRELGGQEDTLWQPLADGGVLWEQDGLQTDTVAQLLWWNLQQREMQDGQSHCLW